MYQTQADSAVGTRMDLGGLFFSFVVLKESSEHLHMFKSQNIIPKVFLCQKMVTLTYRKFLLLVYSDVGFFFFHIWKFPSTPPGYSAVVLELF